MENVNLLQVGKKYISIDSETDGLWGNPFAVAAIVYECKEYVNSKSLRKYLDLTEVDRICLRLPNDVVKNEWVKENVLPTLDFEITNQSYEEMLKEFASFYLKHKDSTTIWHMGHVVESHLFRELHRLGFIGDWDAPYTPIDVSDMLRVIGEPSDSVDSYYKKYNLSIIEGNTHNPLYDCKVAAEVLNSIAKKIK